MSNWKNDWVTETGKPLGSGAQGTAFKVKPRSDPTDVYPYVLKLLNDQKNVHKRCTFFREINTLEILDHPGIPKLISHNGQDFRNNSIDLFMVTEFVHGMPLLKHDMSKVSFEDAINLTIRVVEILAYCHRNEVIHRDVKPQHVILRNNDLLDPVLIDFGIAYCNNLDVEGGDTLENRPKGNRFLIGPEQQPGKKEFNRTPALDLSQAIGLLYFILTGQFPGLLKDDNNLPPHKRVDWKSKVNGWKYDFLSDIFDKAFQWQPHRRFQNAGELLNRLGILLGDTMPAAEAIRKGIQDGLEATSYFKKAEILEDAIEICTSVHSQLEIAVRTAFESFDDSLELKVHSSRCRTIQKTIDQNPLLLTCLRLTCKNSILNRSVQLEVDFRLENQRIQIGITTNNADLRLYLSSAQLSTRKFELDSESIASDSVALLARVISTVVKYLATY